MAGYLILLYENEASWADADEVTSHEIYAEHGAFGEANRAAVSAASGPANPPPMTRILNVRPHAARQDPPTGQAPRR